MEDTTRKPTTTQPTTQQPTPTGEAVPDATETGTVSHPANIPNTQAAKDAGLDPAEKAITPGEGDPSRQ